MMADKIEKELEEFLGVGAEELREEIINEAVWLRKDHSKMVVFRIFPGGTYDLGIGQEGSYDGYDNGERLWASFSLIEPWDLPDYESITQNDDGSYTDPDTGDEYEDDGELLEAVRTSVASGFYHKFEEEWEGFLFAFQEWRKFLMDSRHFSIRES